MELIPNKDNYEDLLKIVAQIKSFIAMFFESSKHRGRMYGSVSDLESQWHVLDQIYYILESVPQENISDIAWGSFLCKKGYGAKSAATIIEESKADDPYAALAQLRTEYEEWRSAKIQKFGKSSAV